MNIGIPAELTQLLREDLGQITSQAFAEFTPDVYVRLRLLARSVMRGERLGHTLPPTAVLHEAIRRLTHAAVETKDAQHFFRIAARTMRQVLIDYARQRRREKRLSPFASDTRLVGREGWMATESVTDLDMLDIDLALTALETMAPRAAELLELRYFGGLEDAQLAVICNISKATVTRECRFARAFLVRYGQSTPSNRAGI